MFRATMCSSSRGKLYEYNFWYNHSVLVAVRYGREHSYSLWQTKAVNALLLLLLALQPNSLNVLAFSTYNFYLLRSWMQLVKFFIFSFFISFIVIFPSVLWSP